MPANSYAELYDFPGNIAAAAKSILTDDVTALIGADTAADADSFVFGPRENAAMPSDRIEVSSTPFTQASDQQIQAQSNSQWFFAHYSGQIMFSVVTPRSVAAAADEHSARVGRIQYLMQPKAARFTSTNLPHYEILVLRLSSMTRAEPDEEQDVDRSDVVFNVELWIRPTAFPAVLP